MLIACSGERDGGKAAPGQLSIDDDILTWSAVKGTAKYEVNVDGEVYITEGNSYDLFYVAPEEKTYTVKVRALDSADKPISDYSQSKNYVVEKQKLNGYAYHDDGASITIKAYSKVNAKGKFIIPSYIDGKPVTTIYKNGFEDCDELIKIYIPDTVTQIENLAFRGCTSLRAVRLPSGLTEITASLFSGCKSLTSVNIPESVTSMGSSAFANTAIAGNLDLPDGLKTIGSLAFKNTGITAVKIPASVEKIFGNPFAYCKDLTEITVESGNKYYRAQNNCLLEVGTATVLFAKDVADIPSYTMRIGECAFEGNTHLKEAVIPNTILEIGQSAFENCVNLKSTVLPGGLKSIGVSAFSGCTSLENIEIPDTVTVIGKDAFSGCSNLNSIELPGGLKSIGVSAFSGCISLKSVKLPAELGKTTAIGTIFVGCDSLERIEISSSSTKYKVENNCLIDIANNSVIFGCKTSVIPDYITEIGDYAFYGSGIESFTVPKGITRIGNYAFSNCNNLKYFYFPDSVTELGYGVFQDSLKLGGIALSQNISAIERPLASTYTAGPSWVGGIGGDFASKDATTLYVYYTERWVTETDENGNQAEYIEGVPENWWLKEGECNLFKGCEMKSDNGYSYVFSYTFIYSYIYRDGRFGGVEQTYSDGAQPYPMPSREDSTEEFFDDFYADYDADMNPRAPMRLGYNFKGWATEEGGKPVYKSYLNKNGTVCALSYAERKTIKSGTKLYAVWEKA